MKRYLPVVAALTLFATRAHAFDDSTRKPFYIQSAVGSFSYWPVLFQNQGYWKPDIEFGFHITGRHDGLALGVRQSFDVGRDVYSMGETVLRGGWDFALPFRNGRFELVLAPFGTFGANYVFQNPSKVTPAGVHFSAGVDVKLFFFQGLYLLVRPIELGLGQFVDLGKTAAGNVQNVYFNINLGGGLGYAF